MPRTEEILARVFDPVTNSLRTSEADPVQYKYVAIISQSTTDDPVAVVLQNTFTDAIVWSYSADGVYLATLAGAFPAGLTFCQITLNLDAATDEKILYAGRQDNDNVVINALDDAFAAVAGIGEAYLEIRVYQA